ncbi:MAG: hypothetical protein U0792_14190 [Gemmataceae bacterium]
MRRVAAVALAAGLLLCLTTSAVPDDAPQPKPNPHASVLVGLKARCIGPANMGGRICDLAVVESDPDTFYVAAASGGVWKTTTGGATFTPIFDDQTTQCIGAIAVCQAKPEVVYVGTGEANPRNSVSWGNGVYRSSDGGSTWTHCGLTDTHHIGRVVVHPTNPDIAYVGALGHCWGANKAAWPVQDHRRGKTWDCVKFIDVDTGFVDVCLDPSNSDTLYAVAWQIRRGSFSGGSPSTQTGPNGGLFKSTDAGKTWTKLSGGLPEKVGYGRCGIAVYPKNPKVVFAVVHTSETAGQLTNAGQPASTIGKNGVMLLGRPETGGVFRSDDAGQTWKKINDLVPRPFYYGQIRVDPTEESRLYVLGVAFHASSDGGRTFRSIAPSIHPDHHALWINPKNPDHLIIGNDGGLYVSKDRGRTYEPKRGLVLSQFYGVAVDNRTPYRVYGGLQDNGNWGGPPRRHTRTARSRTGSGFWSPTDFRLRSIRPTRTRCTARSSTEGLPASRLAGKGIGGKSIKPPAVKGEQHRFNWNSPILLSPHDPKTLYFGAQYLYKSTNRGDTWMQISTDLTAAPSARPVSVSSHTILTLAESPVKQGVVWVGTDDGKLWVTKNDGKVWTDVSERIPAVSAARAISKIECSHFEAGTAIVAIDRHRNDDFKPYLFQSTDHGETWKSIAGDLPNGAVIGVVRQSSVNKSLLFVGTEIGLFVSYDTGGKWHHLDRTGLPRGVRVDDLVIHPRERELVIGTHGRGIWIMDISPLEQLTEKVLVAEAHLFDIKPATILKPRKRETMSAPGFKGANPPAGFVVHYWIGDKGGDDFSLTIENPDGTVRSNTEFAKLPGGFYSRASSNLEQPGDYTVILRSGKVKMTKTVKVILEE